MKTLLLSMMILASACNGGGGSSSSSEGEPDPFDNDASQCLDGSGAVIPCVADTTDLEIEYNSYGVYQNTGVSLDLMGTFDQDRPIRLPQFITLVQDSASSVRLNDVVRIKFVDTHCNWVYTAPHFEFYNCVGSLTGANYGDTIYLSDLYNSLNPSRAGQIDMGVVRTPGDNHIGTIIVRANLGQ